MNKYVRPGIDSDSDNVSPACKEARNPGAASANGTEAPVKSSILGSTMSVASIAIAAECSELWEAVSTLAHEKPSPVLVSMLGIVAAHRRLDRLRG